jgi:signal transduction histidine kinase
MDSLAASIVIHSLPFPVVATDPSLRVLLTNEPGRAMLGLPESAADVELGADLLVLIPEHERSRFESASAAAAAVHSVPDTQSLVGFEVMRGTSRGEQPCHIVVTPMREGGQLTGFLFSSRDMSALTEDRRTAEQEATRMEVARQLAATMNHEINNPLFVVSATLEDLLAEIDDPAEQRRLNAALGCVWRVSEAVKKLSEIRQLVTTAYIDGFPMIDLEASQAHPDD